MPKGGWGWRVPSPRNQTKRGLSLARTSRGAAAFPAGPGPARADTAAPGDPPPLSRRLPPRGAQAAPARGGGGGGGGGGCCCCGGGGGCCCGGCCWGGCGGGCCGGCCCCCTGRGRDTRLGLRLAARTEFICRAEVAALAEGHTHAHARRAPMQEKGPRRRCFCCCSVAGGAIDTTGASTRPPPLSPDHLSGKKKKSGAREPVFGNSGFIKSHRLKGKVSPWVTRNRFWVGHGGSAGRGNGEKHCN
ncbi:uncharacterized protein LOC143661103 [Tamandua tetradactyla]|uniref:uncharacterized protein LOC143661103 n=1 Tax=Tamandua tetradactyla TaxID=48850 RepID=UPI0040548CEE